jgi:hypothetical protein
MRQNLQIEGATLQAKFSSFWHRLTSKLKASAVSCAKLPLSAEFFEAVGLEQRQNLVLTQSIRLGAGRASPLPRRLA